MYGNYDIPVNITNPDLNIEVIKTDYGYSYIRKTSSNDLLEKNILADKAKLIINPVEPCNLPKHITNYIMLEFEKNFTIAPNSQKTLFALFPIEIGVFLFSNRNYEPFDNFSFVPAKYYLYGDPRNGIITRHHITPVFASIPSVNKLEYGILNLDIKNADSHWSNISKIIFNAYDMKIYFNQDLVQMHAEMKIINEITAETECYSPSLQKGFKKSRELYKTRKLNMLSTKYTMTEGI